MATDRNGQTLAVGDSVNVPGHVTAVDTTLSTGATVVTVQLFPKSLSGDPNPACVTVDPAQTMKVAS